MFSIFFLEIRCFCRPLMYIRYRFWLLFPLSWQFLCLSLSLSVSHIKSDVGRYASEESNYNNWIILRLYSDEGIKSSRNSQTETIINIILLNVLSSPDFRWTNLSVLSHLQRVLQKLKKRKETGWLKWLYKEQLCGFQKKWGKSVTLVVKIQNQRGAMMSF